MKKLMALLMAFALTVSLSIPAYAVTPAVKLPNVKVPDISPSWELPTSVKMAIDKAVEENVKNVNIKLLTTPSITENRYVHSRASFDKNRLQIRWNTVDEATSYEIVVKKKDGTKKTYTSSYAALVVDKNDDDFITGCIMGGTVKVRAVKDNGAVYSLWTEEDTIACNKVFY